MIFIFLENLASNPELLAGSWARVPNTLDTAFLNSESGWKFRENSRTKWKIQGIPPNPEKSDNVAAESWHSFLQSNNRILFPIARDFAPKFSRENTYTENSCEKVRLRYKKQWHNFMSKIYNISKKSQEIPLKNQKETCHLLHFSSSFLYKFPYLRCFFGSTVNSKMRKNFPVHLARAPAHLQWKGFAFALAAWRCLSSVWN